MIAALADLSDIQIAMQRRLNVQKNVLPGKTGTRAHLALPVEQSPLEMLFSSCGTYLAMTTGDFLLAWQMPGGEQVWSRTCELLQEACGLQSFHQALESWHYGSNSLLLCLFGCSKLILHLLALDAGTGSTAAHHTLDLDAIDLSSFATTHAESSKLVCGCAFSPSGKQLCVTLTTQGTADDQRQICILVIDCETCQVVKVHKAPAVRTFRRSQFRPKWSPQSSIVAAQCHLMHVQNFRVLRLASFQGLHLVPDVQFSSDGCLVGCTSRKLVGPRYSFYVVRLLNTESGAELFSRKHSHLSALFLVDQKQCALLRGRIERGSYDLQVWDVSSKCFLHRLSLVSYASFLVLNNGYILGDEGSSLMSCSPPQEASKMLLHCCRFANGCFRLRCFINPDESCVALIAYCVSVPGQPPSVRQEVHLVHLC